MSIIRYIAHNFSSERRARGYTQQEIADEIGVTKAWICQVETGISTPSIQRLEDLATAIGMDPRSLLRPIGEEYDG
jgi:transcriptional regulator with XRE-family HTH domain